MYLSVIKKEYNEITYYALTSIRITLFIHCKDCSNRGEEYSLSVLDKFMENINILTKILMVKEEDRNFTFLMQY